MKNLLEDFLEDLQAEERISKLKAGSSEKYPVWRGEIKKEWGKMHKAKEICQTSLTYQHMHNGSPRRRERERGKKIIEEIMAENFWNLIKTQIFTIK